MKIVVTRSGGFGGLTRTWSVEVSRSEVEQRWLPLAEAESAGSESAESKSPGSDSTGGSMVDQPVGPPGSAPSAQRDRFTYRIAIGYTEVYLPESGLDDPWRELIDRARAATSARPSEPGNTPVEQGRGADDAGPGRSPELL